MSKRRPTPETPPCYALVLPGLEPVAAEEIEEVLGGEVKRTGSGLVVFRVPEIDLRLLGLRTTEDVFLLAWGTDKLTYRAADLESIRRWTAHEVHWDHLLRIHHAVRPKPKGKPTYHLVAQMAGQHGYRRKDALQALARGLAGKLPASWRPVAEGAAVEIWLTIHGATAVCGVRLSDQTMRHRTYKVEHLPASLRPSLAATMVHLAETQPGQLMLDPMCGAGTILAEQMSARLPRGAPRPLVLGGDLDRGALRVAAINLRRVGEPVLARWDARRLPLPDAAIDRVVSNPPFGKQLARPEDIGPLYEAMLVSYDRVLKPDGRAVLLVSDVPALKAAARRVGWQELRQLRVRVLGQPAVLSVWRKGR